MKKGVALWSGRIRASRGGEVQELQNTLLIDYGDDHEALNEAVNTGAAEFDPLPDDDTVATTTHLPKETPDGKA